MSIRTLFKGIKRRYIAAKMQTVNEDDTELLAATMTNHLIEGYPIEEQTEIIQAMMTSLIRRRNEQIEKTESHLKRLRTDLENNKNFIK